MFTDADRAQVDALGIALDEVQRQIGLFVQPPRPVRLDRPCTVGDGVRVLSATEIETAERAHAAAAAAGRVQKFTPASGAASRMFHALHAVRGSGVLTRAALAARAESEHGEAGEALVFFDRVEHFAFAAAIDAVLARRGQSLAAVRAAGDVGSVIDSVLQPEGLDFGALPKGLLPFHRAADGARTPLEEHLSEAAAVGRDADGVARLHFTVSPEHVAAFRARLEQIRAAHERRCGARFQVGWSVQKPTTDTIAVDAANQPFRAADGRLVFRPSGHGALIENLHDLQADLIFIKTIDNVQTERQRAAAVPWMRILLGYVSELQRERAVHLAALGSAAPAHAVEALRRFATQRLGLSALADAAPAALAQALDRPLRVCGVVRNTGEPGGAPFWVRQPDGGCTAQIVEAAQVDAGDPGQRAVFVAATHFNPVLLACAVRDPGGRPYDLHAFVDPSAVFIARRSRDGRELKALERPGLWNGAMAGWLTVFVEVPETTFTPVKTINDLLRPAHQTPG